MINLMDYRPTKGPLDVIEDRINAWKARTGNSEVVASYGIGGFEGLRKHRKVREVQAKGLMSTRVYPSSQGEPGLREAIIRSHAQDSDGKVKLSDEEVSVSWGARGALMMLMEALALLFGPGAAVIISEPGYGGTYHAVKRAGLRPILVQCGLGANYTEGALRKIAELRREGRALAAVIWEPVQNPTGALGTQKECSALGKATHEADALFVGDEVYLPFVYAGRRCPSVLEVFEHRKVPTVAIRSSSKVHANSQDRIGDIAGTYPVMARYHEVQRVFNYGPPLVCQEGYRVALTECRSSVPAIVRLIKSHAQILYKGFPEIGWDIGQPPDAGMFGLAPVPDGFETAMDFCLYFAGEFGLRFWPLDAFCRPGSSPELVSKARRLIRLPFVETLKGMERTFTTMKQPLRELCCC